MLSLVIPTRNEGGNIEPLLLRLERAWPWAAEDLEVLIVDDGSRDGTRETVLRLAQQRPWLQLLPRQVERDLSTAVVAGWGNARGDILGCMDGDLQHPPELLPVLLAELRQSQAQLVAASRYVHGGGVGDWAFMRRVVSRLASALTNLILPGALDGISDPMSGYFLVRRDAVRLGQLRPRGYKILLEVLARARPSQVREVAFTFAPRRQGASKAGWRISWQFLRQIWSLAGATGELRHMLLFAVVGLSGVGVNYLAFWGLHHLSPAVSVIAAASSALATTSNFFGNEFVTFRDVARVLSGSRLRRWARFSALSLVGLGINTASVTLLVRWLPWTLALAIGIVLASAWNFFSNSTLTWRRSRLGEPQPAVLVKSA